MSTETAEEINVEDDLVELSPDSDPEEKAPETEPEPEPETINVGECVHEQFKLYFS